MAQTKTRAASKNHPMQAIANDGAKAIGGTKDEALEHGKRVATMDDRFTGMTVAHEVFAVNQQERSTWRRFALRIVELTMEGRVSFIDTIRMLRKDAVKQQRHGDTVEAKFAGNLVTSANVQISKLAGIAKAFNAGGSEKGLLQFAKDKKLPARGMDDVNFETMYAYAKFVNGSTGDRGAPKKAFIVKLATYLENAKETLTKDDEEAYAKVVALVQRLTPKAAAPSCTSPMKVTS